jgi:Domain of unknown function (DUF5615)
MRLLLDENLPRKLIPLLAPEVEAVTVAQQGWRGKENGELIALAEREFDALATMDQGIPHQQNLGEVNLALAPRSAEQSPDGSCTPRRPTATAASSTYCPEYRSLLP